MTTFHMRNKDEEDVETNRSHIPYTEWTLGYSFRSIEGSTHRHCRLLRGEERRITSCDPERTEKTQKSIRMAQAEIEEIE